MEQAKNLSSIDFSRPPKRSDYKNLDEMIEEGYLCLRNDKSARALEIAELFGEEIFNEPRFANFKIRTLKKLGNFHIAHEFIKKCSKKEQQKNWDNPKDQQSRKDYVEFMHYKGWEKSITDGRFEQLDKTREYIKEYFGELNEQMGSNYFFTGWLYVGDKKYDLAIKNLNKSIEIYLKVYGTEDHLDIAECHRYIGQCYYHQNDQQNAINAYEIEKKIRSKIQGEECGEFAVVLNSLANIYGCQMKDYDKGLDYISKAIQIYDATIGFKNQNYTIAIDWMGWYLNALQRYDEAVIIWERAILLAYQVFGGGYYIYHNLRDSNLWNLYRNHFDLVERIKVGYLEKAQEAIEENNFNEAQDLLNVALDLQKKITVDMTFGEDKITYTQVQLDNLKNQIEQIKKQLEIQKQSFKKKDKNKE